MARDLRRYAVVNARLRALRGALLGPSALEALYTYPTVGAMQDALQRTVYADEAGRRVVEAGIALIDRLDGPPRRLLHEYLKRYEVDGIKLAIRVASGRRPRSIAAAPVLHLGPLATIDIDAVLAARDLDDLVARLAGSAYHAVLQSALPRITELGAFALESAVELDFYERLWSTSFDLQPSDRVRVNALLAMLYDILNLQWIAHYRDGALLSAEETLNYTLRQGGWITLERRRRLAQAPGEWLGALGGTPFEPFALIAERDGADAGLPQLWRLLAAAVRTALRGYPFHGAAPLALLMGLELEIRDIRALLAMKRLGRPASDVLPSLASAEA